MADWAVMQLRGWNRGRGGVWSEFGGRGGVEEGGSGD